MDQIKLVEIDDQGVFKYIQIQDQQDKQIYIRGFKKFEFHAEILEDFEQKNKNKKFECIGGGRIKHEEKSLFVYGYSKGYGQCDHNITVKMLQQDFPDYQITFSNDGY